MHDKFESAELQQAYEAGLLDAKLEIDNGLNEWYNPEEEYGDDENMLIIGDPEQFAITVYALNNIDDIRKVINRLIQLTS